MRKSVEDSARVSFNSSTDEYRLGKARMRSSHLAELIVSAVLAALVAATATFAASNSTARFRYLYFKVKSPVARGELAHVVVQGRTGLCRITVSKGGTQMQLGPRPLVNPLRPKLSRRVDDNRVAWEWKVPTNTTIGLWRVRVNCGRAATLQGTFLVTG
jgi:hypothetical protein